MPPAGTDAGVALARELGADHGINYRKENLEARVNDLTNKSGVDVVFENIGAPDLWPAAFNSLGGGGRLVTAGAHGGGTVTLDVKRLYRRKLQLIGGAGSAPKDVEANARRRTASDRTFQGPRSIACCRSPRSWKRIGLVTVVELAHVTGKVVLVHGPSAILALH